MSRYRKSEGDARSSFLSSSLLFNGQSPNAEQVHLDALAAAQAEHERVREAAIRAYRNNELREAKFQLELRAQQELERLELEREQARLAAHVIELQKKQVPIPKPPPREPTPPPPPSPPKSVEPPKSVSHPVPQRVPHQEASKPTQNGIVNPFQRSLPPHQQPPIPVSNSVSSPSSQSAPRPNFVVQQPKAQPASTQATVTVTQSSENQIFPEAQRYIEIHRKLKELRVYMVEAGTRNIELKKKMGEMRREIRKSVGQITEGKAANQVPMKKIVDTLKAALSMIPSPPIDPRLVMVDPPSSPQEGAENNGDTLPTLYIYLLNIFAKAVVSQFIDEAGVSPKAAEPIGVLAVSIFAQKALTWRNTSLISILIAKIRIVCPVLFGVRGSEKTQEGRVRLGWRKDDSGHFLPEQVHNQRMTGVGAGYASISLRDFTRSKLVNPYPPSNYWRTLAAIVDTPPQETSATQFTVLKALIENYEASFMKFYGDMARAALQVALVDFPARAPEKNVAVSALLVLGDILKKDTGLRLNTTSQQQPQQQPQQQQIQSHQQQRQTPFMATNNTNSFGGFGGFR